METVIEFSGPKEGVTAFLNILLKKYGDEDIKDLAVKTMPTPKGLDGIWMECKLVVGNP